MGRALVLKSPLSSSSSCTLASKNSTHAITTTGVVVARTRPYTLEQLLVKTWRYYRDDISAKSAVPTFIGPGGVQLKEPESSFGLLYATSLRRRLADDLLATTTATASSIGVTAPWPGASFLNSYAKASSTLLNCSSADCSSISTQTTTPTTTTTNGSLVAASAMNAALWGSRNWAWSSGGQPRGTVNRSLWLQNRYAACQASYSTYYFSQTSSSSSKTAGAKLMGVRPIPLCEPAPTGSLQTFCTAMLQYRTDISNVNCELMGGGTCLYKPGAFYVPYAWSATNQVWLCIILLFVVCCL